MKTRAAGSVVLVGVLAASGALGAFGSLAACGSSSDGGSGFDDTKEAGPAADGGPLEGLQTIEVTPAEVTIVAGDTNQPQTFAAKGRFADGSTRDVTAEVSWKASPDAILGGTGPTATPIGSRGGDATVAAFAGSVTGTATVHVKWVKTVLASGVAPGSDARFTGAAEDPALAATVAYPLDGALTPPNLPPMEIQIEPAAGTDLFDVHVAGPNVDAHYVSTCAAIGSTGGCGIVPDKGFWTSIATTLGGQDPGVVTVRAAGATPGKIGSAPGVSLQFAGDDLRGGLYYFNTRATPPDGKPGIFRYDFESEKVGPFYTAGQCAGCHALSKDGTKMLAPICTDERGCGRPMQLAVIDVATKQVVTPPMPVGDSDTQTWTPDDAFYVTTPSCSAIDPGGTHSCTGYSGGTMTLVSAATNTAIGPVPSGPGAMYPSFSNDGKKLVYARAKTYRAPLSIQTSSLFTLDFDPAKATFGAETQLLASSGVDYENDYHPSFSPDDAWIVFSRSHCTAGDDPNAGDINGNVCDSYNDYTARSWVVPAAGGAAIELAKANGQGRNTVSWPKWAPFKSTYKGGDLFYVTVASTRDYGFRALHDHDAKGNPSTGVTQLWLVAFDPAKAAAGADPSFAPIWLPFQDVESSNHIGQWATKIVGPVN
jgi:hypothetical protein